MSWVNEVLRQKNKTPVNFSTTDSCANYKPAILSTLSTVRLRLDQGKAMQRRDYHP